MKLLYKVLHLVWGKPYHQYSLGMTSSKSSPVEKDLGVLVNEKQDMTWQRVLGSQKAKCILGCVRSSVASRLRKMTLPFYSTLMRLPLQCCVQPWGS